MLPRFKKLTSLSLRNQNRIRAGAPPAVFYGPPFLRAAISTGRHFYGPPFLRAVISTGRHGFNKPRIEKERAAAAAKEAELRPALVVLRDSALNSSYGDGALN